MPISLVQSNVASAASCAYLSNNTAGNLLVAVLQDSNDPVGITLSDTLGNTWAKAVGQYNSGSALSLSIWYVANSRAGANTVTVAGGFASFQNVAIAEYSGIATVSPLDQTAIAFNSIGNPDSGSTAATTQASELLIGGIGTNVTTGITWSGGFTARQSASNGGANRKVWFADEVVAATGTYNAAGTYASGTGDWFAAIATFKAATGFDASQFPWGTVSGQRPDLWAPWIGIPC